MASLSVQTADAKKTSERDVDSGSLPIPRPSFDVFDAPRASNVDKWWLLSTVGLRLLHVSVDSNFLFFYLDATRAGHCASCHDLAVLLLNSTTMR